MVETCTLSIQQTEQGCVFRIHGRGTVRESATIRDCIRGVLERSAHVVLDLSECDYLDSTFCGCLLILHQSGLSGEGSLRIFADPDTRKRLLNALRLDRVLEFTEALPETVGDPAMLRVSEIDQPEFCQHMLETHRKLAELVGPAADTFLVIANQLSEELDRSR